MVDHRVGQLPPLQGCLYCHSEGTTSLTIGRKWWRFGSDYPLLKCSHCNSTALLDYSASNLDRWQICYRRVNRAPRYYYVALHFGQSDWLPAPQALAISTDGFVQRKRVAQAKAGELDWLQPPPADIPDQDGNERVYLSLKGVTLQNAPPPGLFSLGSQEGPVLNSGKLLATDRALYLLGQRRNWSQPLEKIWKVSYDRKFWTVIFVGEDNQLQQYRGVNATDQWDAQLISTVIEALWNPSSD